MAKGFKQATNSLNGETSETPETTSRFVTKDADRSELTDSQKVTEPTVSTSGIKLGKEFLPASGIQSDYTNPIVEAKISTEEHWKAENTGSINNESVTKEERYYSELLPTQKKKSHKALIVGIAAAVVFCASVAVGMKFLNNNADIALNLTDTEVVDNSANDTNYSSNMASTVNVSCGSVFTTFSAYSHSYEKQQVSLIGMTSEEKSNYDKTTISLPADMEGGDKNFVGSKNPSGSTFKWKNSHNKNIVYYGKSSITVNYGDLDVTFKEYMNKFSKIYTELTNAQVVTYDSSKYKSSGSNERKKEEQQTFNQLCQKSFDYIQQQLQIADVNDYDFTNNDIYLQSKTQDCSLREKYYYSDDICAREMIVYNPLHTSVSIKMLKAVNCGSTVRLMYCEYYNDSCKSGINGLREGDLIDLYQIEQTMIDF